MATEDTRKPRSGTGSSRLPVEIGGPSILWIVLPIYNEQPRLEALFSHWEATLGAMRRPARFVLVDDGSSDGSSASIARFAAGRSGVDVISHSANRGLGRTLQDGLQHVLAHGAPQDLVITMDADDTQPPSAVPEMLGRLESLPCDVVIASRFRPGSKVVGVSAFRQILSVGAAVLFRLLAAVPNVRDYTCGFRVCRLRALRRGIERSGDRIFSGAGFECTASLLLALADTGAACAEVPFTLEYAAKGHGSHLNVGRTTRGTLKLLWRHRRERFRASFDR